MKKISIIATALTTAALTFALVSSASAQAVKTASKAKPKTRTTTAPGSSSAATAGQGANATARAGMPGVSSGNASAEATGNMLLNSGSVTSTLDFSGSCDIGDGVTLISKAQQAQLGRAFTMQIAGGQGCLASLPDTETATTAVTILNGAVQVASRLGVQNLTEANDSQDREIVEGAITSMEDSLGLDRETTVGRAKGICSNCDILSQQACAVVEKL